MSISKLYDLNTSLSFSEFAIMNINDFVILPGSKTGVSVKLKEKSVRELQLEKVQLELENKEMEKKLKQLQSNMSREKQDRGRTNGYRWKSGHTSLNTQPHILQDKENAIKVPSAKVKLRLLKEHIPASDAAKQPFLHKTANDAATERPKVKGKACGQCEMKIALLVCLECGEDYCPSCFARIHQKGALKLHRTTYLQGKAHIPVGKLEAAQQFLKTVNPSETNDYINNGQEKKVTNAVEDMVAVPPPSPKIPTDNTETQSTVSSTEGWAEIQSGGFLLHGTFDENESAKSFQEALNQWRSGNCSQKSKEERSCQVGSENSGTCQVQTSPPIMKKSIEIEFKEDSLNYMERLLIKKHRRAPNDELSYNIIVDELKLKESLSNGIPDTWNREKEEEETEKEKEGEEEEEEEEEDIINAREIAIEMKKYWADVLEQEEPGTVLTSSEPSLKIKILDDACKEETEEESTNFIVMEAGSDELIYYGSMSKTQKTEPDVFLPPFNNMITRSPLSSIVNREKGLTFLCSRHEETPKTRTSSQFERADVAGSCSCREEMTPNSLSERAITKDKSGKIKKKSFCMSNEQTPSPPQLAASKSFPAMELVKENNVSQGMHDASPVIPEYSLLSQVALREKPVCNPYKGLEEFFTMGSNCLQLKMKSVPSPYKAQDSPKNIISFSGPEQWTRHLSLGECADECVVQEILNNELGRPLTRLGRQTPCTRLSQSNLSIGNASSRPFSANIPLCKMVKHHPRPSSVIETGSKHLNTQPLSQAAFEISEISGIDVTENDDPSLEYHTSQQTLTDLDHELKSISDSWENLNGLNRGDFNRYSKITYRDLHNNYELKDCSQGDAVSFYDEHYTDDEEDKMDRQQVSCIPFNRG
ncbi:zinc finger B-box domain-containing protein 1 isoform X2 [Pantherophis guttatus]|uniref:Zinc finger B-box domain-containing protein 1 isoform X2 n=1 Tax=Pantherophis guttatus TaxID=94885 RepID=A0ABM3YSI9_PANGU|nr:zinc finger B-box domain-containing protein 1 isoform X2 [Pantherophis guttatus]